jgi:hypothetical protein
MFFYVRATGTQRIIFLFASKQIIAECPAAISVELHQKMCYVSVFRRYDLKLPLLFNRCH